LKWEVKHCRKMTFTSSRKKNPIVSPTRHINEATKHGKKYGYFFRKVHLPNIDGYCSTGFARNPPIIGPMMIPIPYIKGKNEKAVAKSRVNLLLVFVTPIRVTGYTTLVPRFVSSVISANILLITPTFPFRTPHNERLTIAQVNEVLRPKSNELIIVPNRPVRITGLLPAFG
jgi:hypothetical protein